MIINGATTRVVVKKTTQKENHPGFFKKAHLIKNNKTHFLFFL